MCVVCMWKKGAQVRESPGFFVLILERAFSLLFWRWPRPTVACVTVLNKQPVNGIPIISVFCRRDAAIRELRSKI